MKSRKARSGEHNYPFIDRYSAAHFVVGVASESAGLSFGQVLATSIAWEIVEPTAKSCIPVIFPKSTIDTAQNKVGDIASSLFGWWIANKIKSR